MPIDPVEPRRAIFFLKDGPFVISDRARVREGVEVMGAEGGIHRLSEAPDPLAG